MPPQTQSHLQFTPFYVAGSLGLYIDEPPTWPFNMILSAHRVFRQHNTKRQLSLFSLKLARYFFFLLEIWNQYGVCRSQHDLTLSESCFHALLGSGEGYFPSASFWLPCALTTQSLALQTQFTLPSSRVFPSLPWNLETLPLRHIRPSTSPSIC